MNNHQPNDLNPELEALDEHLRRLTIESFSQEWFSGKIRKPRDRNKWICFLGTGGSPRNLLTQTKRTGGFVLNFPDFMMHIDPGPGAIYHANYFGLDLTALDAVFVSHGHTDHFTEAGVVIEAMSHIMSQRRGAVLAPGELLEQGYITRFHQGKLPAPGFGPYRGGPAAVLAMQAENPLELHGDVVLIPHRAYHGNENYGFTLAYKGLKLGYTSDTSYIRSFECKSGEIVTVNSGLALGEMRDFIQVHEYHEDLKENYAGLDILIANVGFHHTFAHRHLTAYGLIHLLKDSGVKLCLITHLDIAYFINNGLAHDMARYIQEMSGVRCIVPEEGAKIEL
ncbi:MAG: MBL fold metallo-hydrolase [Chloroflexi bacterium]|uniref:MBL fold metallo-hydrolase n=1 Tax=Candidatus Chlorohelix allophototropha TaxID=3003348 RepID=A0A8T7LZW1_9CHLR|nr:MBL fold metallo-hydrolase [Chloroflexota bacterium]WJW66033.1 MBL fold metallo-hydrolase [Chloroflexota bacterium L227-S17]